jgi:hypothetical protein
MVGVIKIPLEKEQQLFGTLDFIWQATEINHKYDESLGDVITTYRLTIIYPDSKTFNMTKTYFWPQMFAHDEKHKRDRIESAIHGDALQWILARVARKEQF